MSAQPGGDKQIVSLFDPMPHRYIFVPDAYSQLSSQSAELTRAAGRTVYIVVDSGGNAMGLRVPHYIVEPLLSVPAEAATPTASATPASTPASDSFHFVDLYYEGRDYEWDSDYDWEWPEEDVEPTPLPSPLPSSENSKSSDSVVQDSDDAYVHSNDVMSDSGWTVVVATGHGGLSDENGYDFIADSGDESEDELTGSEWMDGGNDSYDDL